MSEQATEQDAREAVEFPHQGDVAFGALMDALASEGEAAPGAGAAGAEGAPAVRPGNGAAAADGAPAGGAAGQSRPAGGQQGEAAADGGADADGAGAEQAGRAAPGADGQAEGGPEAGAEQPGGSAEGGAAEPAAPGAAAAPAEWTASAAEVAPKLAELSAKVEENVLRAYQQRAYNAVKEEHGKYFEALEKHPRLLVGTKVPSIGKEGDETLRSSKDAREWQEAVKSVLVQEIDTQARTGMQESRTFLETVHAAIDLFKNNTDLIPGTKGFDRDLADEFAALAKPYEVRVEGRLQGYSIPVQPLIDNLRAQRKEPPPSTAVKKSEQSTQPPADPPQAGIPTKAASSAEKEDFSTLFGTIGLPNLRI